MLTLNSGEPEEIIPYKVTVYKVLKNLKTTKTNEPENISATTILELGWLPTKVIACIP